MATPKSCAAERKKFRSGYVGPDGIYYKPVCYDKNDLTSAVTPIVSPRAGSRTQEECFRSGKQYRHPYYRSDGSYVRGTCVSPRGEVSTIPTPHVLQPTLYPAPIITDKECFQQNKSYREGYYKSDGTFVQPACVSKGSPWLKFLREYGHLGYSRDQLKEMYHSQQVE